VNNKSEVGLI